jgi:hypothetical protein
MNVAGLGSQCHASLGLRLEGGLGLGDDLREGAFVLNGDVREDLAIKQDVGGLETFDKAVVVRTLRFRVLRSR